MMNALLHSRFRHVVIFLLLPAILLVPLAAPPQPHPADPGLAIAASGGRPRGVVTATALPHAAIQGMTAVLNDSHTGFIQPDANRERQLRQQGQAGFSGIGVVLMPREGRYYIRDTIPGGPAQAAGVQPLDRRA